MPRTLEEGKEIAEFRAREIIHHYSLRIPSEIDIEAIADLRNALVREEHLEGCEGRLIKKGTQGIITVNSQTTELGRKRFTIAHELGHFELHSSTDLSLICLPKDIQFSITPSDNKIEFEANTFAAELLMPESMFSQLCLGKPPTLNFIQELAATFNTTLTATALRYVNFSPYRCAVICSKSSSIEWAKGSTDFGYFLQRGTPLHQDCLAFDFFKGINVPRSMQPVLARAWIQDQKVSTMARLQEQSWTLGSYERVLSLIWLDDQFEEEEQEDEDEEGL